MQDAVSKATNLSSTAVTAAVGASAKAPALTDWVAAIASSTFLVLSFPDFSFWPLAWVAFAPLLIVIGRNPAPRRAFLLGWLTGAVFFYGSCHWLTFSMVNYGGVPSWAAYLLLLPAPLIAGLFPAAFALILARAVRKWGTTALLVAPLLWSSLEWARLTLIGQLWNALGYSQAFQPVLIQAARWGGVYAVGFLVMAANSAIAFVLLKRSFRAGAIAGAVLAVVSIVIFASHQTSPREPVADNKKPAVVVVALQPNVPMSLVKSNQETQTLIERHLAMSENALRQLPNDGTPRLVIWPESPMNFAYGNDASLRELLVRFATKNQTAVLLNSQELAPNDGIYNSAVLVNQEGSLIAQYDKIRLLPFGEYVPLPRWMPGSGLIGAIVGDFTPGSKYTLMPVGDVRMGVFICIESAYPSIVRSFTQAGADVLINISNDGYLGPTAVMRQHLANGVFRAVENGRPVLRVTNTGISAYITAKGEVKDTTDSFQTAVRTWTIARSENSGTFYSKRGDLFAGVTSAISCLLFITTFSIRKKTRGK
ncbi:MAG: apolipoprotein N-acyltransferase [Pyrinomonadaceae bacterium]